MACQRLGTEQRDGDVQEASAARRWGPFPHTVGQRRGARSGLLLVVLTRSVAGADLRCCTSTRSSGGARELVLTGHLRDLRVAAVELIICGVCW